MKKVKFALAGVALVTAALTMSFTMTNNEKTTSQDNDCWSTAQRHLDGLPADLNQADDCPGEASGCCVKPDPQAPTGYAQFSEI